MQARDGHPPLWRVGVMMLASMTLIVGADTAGKVLTQDNVSPVFIAWTRFAIAAVLIAPFCGLTRADAPALSDPRIWVRALLIMGGISCILTALRTEPVANTFGAFFIGPVVAYALSALLLKERITPARTLLLGLSFVGVLMVVKPGFGATLGMGLAVLAGVFHGCYVVSTRWVAQLYRPRLLLFTQLLLGAVILAPFGLAVRPDILTTGIVLLVTLSALGSALGNLLLVMLSKTTPSSVIAPLIYTQLLSATVLGYLVFGDWPDLISFAGLALIFATGLTSLAIARR